MKARLQKREGREDRVVLTMTPEEARDMQAVNLRGVLWSEYDVSYKAYQAMMREGVGIRASSHQAGQTIAYERAV